jgi:hypothetical protein
MRGCQKEIAKVGVMESMDVMVTAFRFRKLMSTWTACPKRENGKGNPAPRFGISTIGLNLGTQHNLNLGRFQFK